VLQLVNLRTDYKINPLGLETQHPEFSWEIRSDGRNLKQTAYQIRCAFSQEDLDNNQFVWDTDMVNSDQSVHIKYQGPELKSGQRLYWQVRIRSNRDEVSDWSRTVFWEMGIVDPGDWQAKWIQPDIDEDVSHSSPAPFLRTEFDLSKTVKKATVFITSLGLYQLFMNGEMVGDDLFTPGWTSYKTRLQYKAYDVTGLLDVGPNAIGVILGDGWYRGFLGWEGKKNTYGEQLALLFQLMVDYTDGTTEIITSNDTWHSTNRGPILKSDIYNGETYDARLEMPGWSQPFFCDEEWSGVIVRPLGYDNVVPSEGIPVRITQIIRPVRKFVTPKGEMVFDLGQNMVGWVRFSLKGNEGDKIVLNHAEVLDQEGNVYLDNLRTAKAEDTYIFNGDGIEVFEPHFTFHGFRYIKISHYKGEISLEDIEGRVIHSDMFRIGSFKCSNKLVNKLVENIDWGLRGNFLDVPTDCPQRDERLGWTGDAQVFAPTACYVRDVAAFFRKWMKDFIVDQRKDGSVPWVVPNVVENGGGTGWSDGFGASGWADAAVIIPWTVYCFYGDKRILEEQYESMEAWENYMIQKSGDTYIFDYGFHFGDWLSFAEYYSYQYNAPDYGYAGANTDKDLVATAYFYFTTTLMQKIAAILGKDDDSGRFALVAKEIKEAFCKEFITPTGRLSSNTQAAYALALGFGLIPDEYKESAVKRLTDDVNHFGHLTTGFLGTPLLCSALTESGHPDLAYKLLFNERYPSWLYPVKNGATTIWERWDGIKPDGGFQNVGMNSFNHYAYGAIGNWLFAYVAGLKYCVDEPGFKSIEIKPYPTDALAFARAELHSMYGLIKSSWEIKDGEFILHAVIPPNTTAKIYLPGNNLKALKEGEEPVLPGNEIIYEGTEDSRLVIKVGSGEYHFRIPCNLVK
jgi:alpha-L-rhamnosidase